MKRTPLQRRLERGGIVLAFLVLAGSLGLLWSMGVSSVRHLAANLLGSYFILWGLALLVVKASRAALATRFALSSVALGAVLLGLEAVSLVGPVDFRIVFGLTVGTERWRLPHNTFDPELGWVHKPYARLAGAGQGDLARALCLADVAYPYDVRLDRHGFRNDRDLSTADVAVVGDSFVDTVETPSDRLMTTVLGQLTESTVANLGRGGYGPQQTLIVLRRYALPLNPKVIVWAFYEGNDLHDVVTYDRLLSALRSGELDVQPSAYERSFARSALGALYQLLDGCTPAWPNVATGVFRNAAGRNVQMHFLMLGPPENDRWSPEHESALGRVREALQHAHELTRSRGIALVVAFIPMSFRVYGDAVQCADDSNCAGWALNDLPQRLEAVIGQISDEIRYVDLTPRFVAEAKRRRLLYLPDDTHWTVDGHRLAAEVIAEALEGVLRKRR